MKDGKYRLTINSFKTDNQFSGRTGIEGHFTDKSIKKNGEIKDYPSALKKAVLGVYDLIEVTLSEKINEKDDF